MLKAMIIGHLGKDALVKEVGGKNVINFNVAHSEKYTNAQGEKIEKTIWAECSYWTEKTAIAPYLLKGTQVYVEGQPEAGCYTDKEGKPVGTLKIRVMNIQLLGSANGTSAAAAAPAAAKQQTAPPPPPPPVWNGTEWVTAAPGAKAPPAAKAPEEDLPF